MTDIFNCDIIYTSYERDDYMSTLEERIEKDKEKYQKFVKNVERLQKKYDNLDFDKVTAMWPEDRKARSFEVEQVTILYQLVDTIYNVIILEF